MAKYSVNNHSVENIISWINSGEIAIPEMQRPFVWEASKVRDLMDSLYKGYPVGYIIIWKNPDVKLKDGTFSNGKKIVIDGQQRITALTAAITGQEVVNQEYKKFRLKFHLIHLMKNLKFVIQHSKRTVNISMIYLKFLNLILIVLILLYSMATKMIQILLILIIHLLS